MTDASSKRYIVVSIEKFSGLCPMSSYALTFHSHSNVGDKCKKVGPFLGGGWGVVSESIGFGRYGELGMKFKSPEKLPFSIFPT